MLFISEAKEFSIQAIYKALRLLERDGVVVKHKKKYSVRVPWVLDLKRLADEASKNIRNDIILPKPGKRIIWHFNDLLALNNFWSQILLLIINSSYRRNLYTWMPHPWFHLAYSEQEEQYIRALVKHLSLRKNLTTILDRCPHFN